MRWLAMLGALCAGCFPPSHVLLRVDDPNGATGDVVELQVQRDGRDPRTVAEGPFSFPFTVPLTSDVRGTLSVTVSGLNGDREIVAQVTKELRFDRSGTPTDSVILARVCTVNADCPDQDFCDGAPTCVAGLCEYALPCVSDFPCVITSCNEETDSCSLTVDHGRCDSASYCDPGSGCTEGQPCLPETVTADCDDGNSCNGVEQCINFRCLGGVPPDVSDGDVCTLDGCDDNRRDSGLEPIFNIPLSSLDGSVCQIPGGGERGVCVSEVGGCSTSSCGDGVVDDGSNGGTPEVCDDGPRNSDAWDVEQHCNADCSGFGPFCGDATVDEGFETCDDGSRFDSGNGCSDTCQRNDGGCGDGIPQLLFEECDDGRNGDNCDGCRDDCTFGCICATGAGCDGAGELCDDGQCLPCDNEEACGAGCLPCGGATPVCGGVDQGCVCVSDGTVRGSCFPGARCEAGVCEGCDTSTTCGAECGACSAPVDVCLGGEGGCAIPTGSECSGQPDYIRCDIETINDLSFDVCLAGQCRSPGCGDSTCNTSGAYFALGDTNQQRCYNDRDQIPCPGNAGDASCGSTPFCGQDAQYEGLDYAGQFTRESLVDGEPVVRSSITGLLWQGCTGGLFGDDCSDGSEVAGEWQAAVDYCEALRWGGYTDWRLPSRVELQSLQDYSRVRSIDPVAFPNTPTDFHWANDFAIGATDVAWQVSFAESRASDIDVLTNNVRRCVRGGADPGALSTTRLTRSEPVSGEPVVVDAYTDLVWQGCVAGIRGADCQVASRDAFEWREALAYCEGLSWGGFDDWFLPNAVELASAIDHRRAGPAVDLALFPETAQLLFWSSTTYQLGNPTDGNPQAWSISFFDGDQQPSDKNNAFPVRCVRRP